MAETTPITTPESAGGPDKDAKLFAMLAHLLGIFTGFIGALVIWLIKKDEKNFATQQAQEALNFQITVLIGYVLCGFLSCLLIGFFLLPVLWLVNVIFCILGAMKANNGEAYRYPFALRLIK